MYKGEHQNKPQTYIIDVLSDELIDLIPVHLGKKVFSNGHILKILHGCGGSDLQWVIRDYGIRFISVFDTQEF